MEIDLHLSVSLSCCQQGGLFRNGVQTRREGVFCVFISSLFCSVLFSFASFLYVAAEASGFSVIFDVTSSFGCFPRGPLENAAGSFLKLLISAVFSLHFSMFDRCSSLHFACWLMDK